MSAFVFEQRRYFAHLKCLEFIKFFFATDVQHLMQIEHFQFTRNRFHLHISAFFFHMIQVNGKQTRRYLLIFYRWVFTVDVNMALACNAALFELGYLLENAFKYLHWRQMNLLFAPDLILLILKHSNELRYLISGLVLIKTSNESNMHLFFCLPYILFFHVPSVHEITTSSSSRSQPLK